MESLPELSLILFVGNGSKEGIQINAVDEMANFTTFGYNPMCLNPSPWKLKKLKTDLIQNVLSTMHISHQGWSWLQKAAAAKGTVTLVVTILPNIVNKF